MWRAEYLRESVGYTDKMFLDDLDELWHVILPLYKELHAYIRRVLINKFPEENIDPHGPVPAHMMGK